MQPPDKEHNGMVRNERCSPEINEILIPFHFISTWIVGHAFFDGHLIQYNSGHFWWSWEVCHFHAESLEYVGVETRIYLRTNYVSLLVSDSSTLSLAPELWKLLFPLAGMSGGTTHGSDRTSPSVLVHCPGSDSCSTPVSDVVLLAMTAAVHLYKC